MKKRIVSMVTGAVFIALFLVCMFPYSFFQMLTGTESTTARDAFWSSRFQCMSLFIGVMFIVGALRIFVSRRVDPNSERVHPLTDLEEQEVRNRNRWHGFRIPSTFVLTGKRAVRYGIVMMLFGIVQLGFGVRFWAGTFLPSVREGRGSASQALHGTADSRADASASVP
jgi:hypothetical protein